MRKNVTFCLKYLLNAVFIFIMSSAVNAGAYVSPFSLLYGDIKTNESDTGIGLSLSLGYIVNNFLTVEAQVAGFDDYDYTTVMLKPRYKLEESKFDFIYVLAGSASMKYNKGNQSDSGTVAGFGYMTCSKEEVFCLNAEYKSIEGNDTSATIIGAGVSMRFK